MALALVILVGWLAGTDYCDKYQSDDCYTKSNLSEVNLGSEINHNFANSVQRRGQSVSPL